MTCCYFPDADRRVQAAGGDELAVGREGDGGDSRIITGRVGIINGQNLDTVR